MKKYLSCTVIIPVYNRTNMLARLLSNLNNQTLLPQRVILVDDGSDDFPYEHVKKWKKDNSPQFIVDFIKHPNTKGVSAARNSGIEALGKCDYVYFLDSDDFPCSNFLEKTSRVLGADPNMVAVNSRRIFVYDDKRIDADISKLSHNVWQWILINGAGVASCTLLRAEAVQKVGTFNTMLTSGEDIDFFSRIALLGKWGFTDETHIEYSRHGSIDHLSSRISMNYPRLWVLIYENCLEDLGVKKFINPEVLRSCMALRWRQSGEQLFIEQRYNEAKECFKNSIRWRAIKNISWFYMLVISFFPPTLKS